MVTREGAFALERSGGEVVVKVRCELTSHTGPALERITNNVLTESAAALGVDLTECPLLDSAGVRALLHLRRAAQSAGVPFRIARCSHAVERVLRMMHLEGVLCLPQPDQPAAPYRANPRWHRYSLRVPIHIWDNLIHRTGETRGLSLEGLVLDIPGPLRLFQVIRLEFTTPDTYERFRFMGRVVARYEGAQYTAEVEYLSLDPAMREWLQQRLPLDRPAPPPPSRMRLLEREE